MSSFMRSVSFVAAMGLALLAWGEAGANPAIVTPGPVVLPLSGLSLELPADPRDGFTWNLSASYALTGDGASFDGRDVLDEKVQDHLVAGTWIQVGYFNAGDCKATVAASKLTDTWTEDRDLYGLRWCLRGGSFDLGQPLGKVPAVAMCTHRKGRKDLLLHRFFLDLPLNSSRETLVAALGETRALPRIARAWQQDAWAAVTPQQRSEVRNRGTINPVRTVKQAYSGLVFTLPDDGYVWLARAGDKDEAVDWLDRMAPALHEVTLEVIRVPDTTCQAVFDAITAEKRYDAPPSHIPEGWTIGPTLVVNGTLERVIGRRFGNDAILVGLFNLPDQGRGAGDFTELGPLLAAIASAAAAR